MSTQNKLLAAAIHNRAAFNKLSKLGTFDLLDSTGEIIWQGIDHYYGLDLEAERVDTSSLLPRLIQKYERHSDIFTTAIDHINKADVSVPNVIHDFVAHKKHHVGMRIASKIVNGEDVEELMDEYQHINSVGVENSEGVIDTEIYHMYHASDVVASQANGTSIVPVSLNNVIESGLHPGHHIILFARVEVGKSLFAIDMTQGFCAQGKRCLYVGNEDPASSMGERFLTRFTGLTRYDIQQLPPEEVMEIACSNGYSGLYFAPLSPGSPREICNLLDRYGPFDVLIVDQLRNLSTPSGGEGKTQQLEQAATAIRFIAKHYGLIALSVTQAWGEAHNKLILNMRDIDSSKTGIPAMADVIMGVGMDDEYEKLDQRMVTFCKNKLTGNHNSVIVKVNRLTSTVLDL